MKKSLFLFALALLVSLCSQSLAQTPPGPPNVALIVREDIKPGKMDPHSKHSASYAQIFSKANVPAHRIALVPVAGSENEVIYLTGAETFAALEQMQQDTDKKLAGATGATKAELDRLNKELPDLHAGMRDMLAVFRSELSYDAPADIPHMRYFAITTVRVRPGQDDVYAEYVRTLVNVARDKAKAELHIAAFQVIAGTPATTYMFFRPMKSLAEYDLRIGPRVRGAMTDDQKKKADKMAGESVVFSETSIYAIDPRMSYVSKNIADADPTFWNPKPEKPAMMMMKKHMKKPAAAKAAGAQPPAKQ
jgi:hypothetical protein